MPPNRSVCVPTDSGSSTSRYPSATAEPLPPPDDLPAADLLAAPLVRLLADARAREVIGRHAPSLVQTELITVTPAANLYGIARTALLTADALRAIGADLAALPVAAGDR